jgi:hypothetical protein
VSLIIQNYNKYDQKRDVINRGDDLVGGEITTKYYLNQYYHRLDGPAVIGPYTQEYWVEGNQYSKTEFWQLELVTLFKKYFMDNKVDVDSGYYTKAMVYLNKVNFYLLAT